MLIDADIISNVMAGSAGNAGSGGQGVAGYQIGKDHSSNGGVTDTDGDLDMGTKGSIFTWSDDDEYYD